MNFDLGATAVAVLTIFGISALIALSLNLEYGVTGIPNFGQAFFVSIGAYTAGLTYTRLLPALASSEVLYPCGSTLARALDLRTSIMRSMPELALANFAITLLIAAVIGGIVGYAISFLALRLKHEWYLALVLLVGGEIVRFVVRGYEPITCGVNGLSGISQPFIWIGNAQRSSLLFMGLVLLAAALAYIFCQRLTHSPFGRMLRAVRENDRVARSLGKNITQARAQVMFIGSMIAAIAGVFYAVNVGFVSTNDYVVTLTLDAWVMIVLGGLGNHRGALLGALLVALLDRATAVVAIQLNMLGSEFEFNYVRYILFGVLLLLMLRYRPQGLLPERSQATAEAHSVLAQAGN